MEDEGLEWQHTPSTVRTFAPLETKNSFLPRSRPFHLFVIIDEELFIMVEMVDYMIGFSNGLVAVGTAMNKEMNKDLSQNQPLTMQFGTWRNVYKFNELHMGCIVRVKSYYRVVQKSDQHPMPMKPIVTEQNSDMFFNFRLSANTVAADWAIVHKPQIQRTLGFVTEFEARIYKNSNVYYEAIVYDQENDEHTDVYDNQWPTYITKKVPVESPVILNWILMDKPHAICYTFENFPTMLPDRQDLKVDERVEKGKWLGWVDTRFKGV